jgi:hypothetical protein
VAINYIYSSIEAILYYPFFIIEIYVLRIDNPPWANDYFKEITIGVAVLAEVMILFLSLVLLMMGFKRKYGRFLFCCGRV